MESYNLARESYEWFSTIKVQLNKLPGGRVFFLFSVHCPWVVMHAQCFLLIPGMCNMLVSLKKVGKGTDKLKKINKPDYP